MSAEVVLLRRGALDEKKGRHVGLLCVWVCMWVGKGEGHEREVDDCLVCACRRGKGVECDGLA